MRRVAEFSAAVSTHSPKLNLTGAHAGFFFWLINLTFASYARVAGNPNFLDDPNVQTGVDCAGYAFTAASILSPFAVAYFGLTLYPRIIFALSQVGLLTAFLNVRRFNGEFVDQISATRATQMVYLIASLAGNAIPPALDFVQSRLTHKSDAITVFSTLSAKSGPIVGAEFGVFLLQLTSFSQHKIAPAEVNTLSNFIVIALAIEFALAYAVQKKYAGDLDRANQWIKYPSILFNLLRELIGAAGNLLIPSNIMSVTTVYNRAPNIVNTANTVTGAIGAAIGVNNFYQAVQKLLPEKTSAPDYLGRPILESV